MNNIQSEIKKDENKSPLNHLLVLAGVNDNDGTTKHIAVKPNRHSLAIFMPKIYGATNPIVTTGIKTQRHILDVLISERILDVSIFGYIPSYGGLREPNKIPLVGNKFRRLYAVVDTCHPLLCGKLQTKHIGVSND